MYPNVTLNLHENSINSKIEFVSHFCKYIFYLFIHESKKISLTLQICTFSVADIRAAGPYEDKRTGPNQVLRPNKVLRTGPIQVFKAWEEF